MRHRSSWWEIIPQIASNENCDKTWARTASRDLAPTGPADHQSDAPGAVLLRQEAAHVLEQALNRLPFYERTALRLLVQQGCSYQDIATAMDTPISTVRTRLWRACHRLRAHGGA